MRATASLLCTAWVIVHTPASSQAAPRESVRIGWVSDGPWVLQEEVSGAFEREIVDLLGADVAVSFPADKKLVADWTVAGVRAAVDRLLADPEIDLVLGLGLLASNELARRPELPKPVVAPWVVDAVLQEIPFADGKSG